MTDRYKVYTKALKMLKEMLSLSHPGHVLTLAMLIAGNATSRKAQLSAVSAETATQAKDKSTEMRLRRWVKHKSIEADVVYLPFAKQILEALSAQPLVLVMDGSQIGRGRMVLMGDAEHGDTESCYGSNNNRAGTLFADIAATLCPGRLTKPANWRLSIFSDQKSRGLHLRKSLFRLGLDWSHYALKSRLDFTPIFRFQSAFLNYDAR